MAFAFPLLSGLCAKTYMPCSMAAGWRGPTAKLRLFIQGVRPTDDEMGPAWGRRVFVTVSCGRGGERTSEWGDWSDQEQQWRFDEVLTLELDADDEVVISWSISEGYNLGVAKLATPPTVVGDCCLPMSQLLPQLQREERELDGYVYAKSDISLDLIKDGGQAGKLYLSFECRRLPRREGMTVGSLLCTSCNGHENELNYSEVDGDSGVDSKAD